MQTNQTVQQNSYPRFLSPKALSKLPPQAQHILNKFWHSSSFYQELKTTLTLTVQKVAQNALNHETFCDNFLTPQRLPNQLIKIFGVNERQFRLMMGEMSFMLENRMHNDLYYQTMLFVYLIGLDHDDKILRYLAIFLITTRLWNGRKLKNFPSFCDPDIARYVLNYEIKKNHTLKKVSSPLVFIDQYLTPHIDQKYYKIIAENPADSKTGLVKILSTLYSRIYGLFDSLREAYYRVHKEGKKEIVGGPDFDLVKRDSGYQSTVELAIDKFEKNRLLRRDVLLIPSIKEKLQKKFSVSEEGLKKIQSWIDDSENEQKLIYFYELFLNELKPNRLEDICRFDYFTHATFITSAKKEQDRLKAKKIVDETISEVLGEKKISSYGVQSLYRYRLIFASALMLYFLNLVCKSR